MSWSLLQKTPRFGIRKRLTPYRTRRHSCSAAQEVDTVDGAFNMLEPRGHHGGTRYDTTTVEHDVETRNDYPRRRSQSSSAGSEHSRAIDNHGGARDD